MCSGRFYDFFFFFSDSERGEKCIGFTITIVCVFFFFRFFCLHQLYVRSSFYFVEFVGCIGESIHFCFSLIIGGNVLRNNFFCYIFFFCRNLDQNNRKHLKFTPIIVILATNYGRDEIEIDFFFSRMTMYYHLLAVLDVQVV